MSVFFFFQAEDGIRALYVTGVQTCALPIWAQLDLPRGVVEVLPRQRQVRADLARLEVAYGQVIENLVTEDDRLAQHRARWVPGVDVRLERVDDGVILRLRGRGAGKGKRQGP